MSTFSRPQTIGDENDVNFGSRYSRVHRIFPHSVSPGVLSEVIQESPGNIEGLLFIDGADTDHVLVKES